MYNQQTTLKKLMLLITILAVIALFQTTFIPEIADADGMPKDTTIEYTPPDTGGGPTFAPQSDEPGTVAEPEEITEYTLLDEIWDLASEFILDFFN